MKLSALLPLPLSLALAACSGGSGDSPAPLAPTSVPGEVDAPTVYASPFDPRVLAFPTDTVGTLTAYGAKSAAGLPEDLTRLTAIGPFGTRSLWFGADGLPERFVTESGGTLVFEWFPDQGTVSITIDGPEFEQPVVELLPYSPPLPGPPPRSTTVDGAEAATIVPLVLATVTGCAQNSTALTVFLDIYQPGTDVLLDRLLMEPTGLGLWQVLIPLGGGIVPPSITVADCEQIAAWYAEKLCTLGGILSLISDLKSILQSSSISQAAIATLIADLLSQLLSGACNTAAPLAFEQWCDAVYQGPTIVGGGADLQGRAEFDGQVVTGPRVFVDELSDFPEQVIVPLGPTAAPVLTITPSQPIDQYVARGTFPCIPPGATTIVVVLDPLNGFTTSTGGTFHPQGALDHSEAVFVGGFPQAPFHVIQAVLSQPDGEVKLTEKVLPLGN